MLAVVGLGYVGLPLAAAFGRERPVTGFDTDTHRIAGLKAGHDPNGEVSDEALKAATGLRFTDDEAHLDGADTFIVTVPTPVDRARRPDLAPLKAATRAVGAHLPEGGTVVFESTVFPGCTEDICIPLLEETSGLHWPGDFAVAYAPERINPGDGMHSLASVVRVVGADGPGTLDRVAGLYESVVEAGVHRVSSIRVAEASKVIENTQRDLNIALMNELAVIFHRLDVDTPEVLEAAGSKWNFLPFRPGLVGGHCIGVDPYYLTYRAEISGYHPQVVLAGRRINDQMGRYIARQAVKAVSRRGGAIGGARIGVMGFSFKENTADVRNTRVADLVEELESYGAKVVVHDPVADSDAARAEHGVTLAGAAELRELDGAILAVAHRPFVNQTIDEWLAMLKPGAVLMDVKAALDAGALRQAGLSVWRL